MTRAGTPRALVTVASAVLALAALAGCSGGHVVRGATTVPAGPTSPVVSTSPTTAPVTSPGPATVSSTPQARIERHSSGALPDPKFTPGAAIPGVTRDDICQPDWNRDHKTISYRVQNKVSKAYGVIAGAGTTLRFDQLIPAALGGTAGISNVWPQPAGNDETPGFAAKNELDARLRRLVCQGDLSLSSAQEAETSNWTTALETYVS